MGDEERLQLGGNPDWMSRLPEELLDVPLWDLAIPGSHDSMSFCLDVSSPVLRSEPCVLRVTDRLFPCCTRTCVYRWATTQQSVLSDQCDLGIRFLDLRIARKPSGGSKLFFAHGIYTLMTVKEALDELATWLDAHPKEIIIISCSHFESLTDEDHVQLVEYIITLFGKKLCSSQMAEKSSEDEGQTLPACKDEEEEMEVTMTTQLENLVVNPATADTTSNTQTHPEETGDVQTDSTAATLSLDIVCKIEDCDDDDSEDSDSDSSSSSSSSSSSPSSPSAPIFEDDDDDEGFSQPAPIKTRDEVLLELSSSL